MARPFDAGSNHGNDVHTAVRQAADPGVDSEKLAFHITLLVLAFFAFFALLTLPRLITRFTRLSEWSRGIVLYKTDLNNYDVWKRKHNVSMPAKSISSPVGHPGLSEDSHTLYSHAHLVQRTDEKGRPVFLSLPPHLASWSSRCHRISAFLGKQCLQDYSVGRSILVLGYASIVLYATVYKSNPIVDLQRSGFMAMAQVPIVFALGTKNNILGMMWALGYEKINWLHRTIGIIFALIANLHTVGFLYGWTIHGIFKEEMSRQSNIFAVVCIIATNIIVFFSTSAWRKKSYYIFVTAHVIGVTLVPITLAFHKPVTIPYVIAAGGVYGLDHIIRLCKTRICKATLRTIPELGITRIDIPYLNAGWRAGQHVRIRVLAPGIGFLDRVEAHPFTIASIGTDGMTLMCKKAGDWTNNLYNATASAAYSGGEGGNCKNARLIVEGPYGGPGHTMFDSFSGAMFVAGGSGITYSLCSVQDLIQKDAAGRSRIKVIELVWTVQDAGSLVPMLPTFTSLIQQAVSTTINISVFYTRASTADPQKLYGYLPPNITISSGRPRFPNILDSVIDRSCALFSHGQENRVSDMLTGVVVGVCGPGGLANDLRKAVAGVDHRRFKAVGGVELCEEVFGW